MLLDFYNKQKLKKPNHQDIQPLGDLTVKVQGFLLPTGDPYEFSTLSPGELRDLFDKQVADMENELKVSIHYALITPDQAKETRAQYEKIYFQDGLCYVKEDLLSQVQKKTSPDTIYVNQVPISPAPTSSPPLPPQSTPENNSTPSAEPDIVQHLADIAAMHPLPKKFSLPDNDDTESFRDDPRSQVIPEGAIGISKSKIREITGYSYIVQKEWHLVPVMIDWQRDLIESEANIIVVDGSRQGGKSLAISEKLIEESFIPGKDMMVAAFLQETTESIGQYMADFIENFDDGTFTIKERKRYIQNNQSGVRIHFRTLKDGAKGIRGKTLRLIVVDEAMLVPTSVFKSVLLPTQTTIQNPKLILLGTASENTNCYMYRTILNIKKGLSFNNEGQRTAKYIKFSVLENPLVSPVMKQEILDDQNSPDTQREYFNTWGKLEDSLFQPKRHSITEFAEEMSDQAHILLAMDPARKKDRSAYVIVHCLNNKAIILSSGEVPPMYKSDWTLQAKFFLDIFKRFKHFKSQSCTIDVTGVGDGVVTIFRQGGLPIADTVRYTAGDTESIQAEGDYYVGKSLLINNTIDMFQEDTLIVPYETNGLLLEEMGFIQMSSTRMGKISFTSDFYDDITNAMMIAMYIARKKKYLNRVAIDFSETITFDSELKQSYVQKRGRWKPAGASGW